MSSSEGTSRPAKIEISDYSDLQRKRVEYTPSLTKSLSSSSTTFLTLGEPTVTRSTSDEVTLSSWFPKTNGQPIVSLTSESSQTSKQIPTSPLRVGIVFAGRPAPGGHCVVTGLFDFLTERAPGSTILGFVSGTKGLFEQSFLELDATLLKNYRNQGGYHLLGRSVDRIRSPKEMEASLAAINNLKLDGLVIIGGTYSNTDAAHLAEYFVTRGSSCKVVGVPVTIDGDVHNGFVETTVGFDTATRVYSQLVGNMATDGNSAKKYWYYVKLMGRSVSRVALEVALQTHPNAVVLSEDIEQRKMTLNDIVRDLADTVTRRAAAGKNFGMVLIPEGVIGSIPELRTLISEMNSLFSEGVDAKEVVSKLTPWSQALLAYLPALIRQQLFLERESSGAVQLSQINTERLLAELVGDELSRRKAAGKYNGKYATICSAFGYQARCSLPSNFDASLGATLGATAASLIAGGFNGYMATVRNLAGPYESWEAIGVPLVSMLVVPAPGSSLAQAGAAAAAAAGTGSSAGLRPVIPSAPVDVLGGAFLSLQTSLPAWSEGELYSNPGPLQFNGPTAELRTLSLDLERAGHMQRVGVLRTKLDNIRALCGPGCSDALLTAALSQATALEEVLKVLKTKE